MCFAPQRRALFRHFFDIWTSKSGPRPSVFNTFDFEMCFAPQRRALFRHLNFQKWSEAGVFCTFWLRNVLRATTACTFSTSQLPKLFRTLVFLTFWLRNVLRATTACTFSTSQLPKVVRRWGVLYILTWKCASRHNGVQFFISHLASWLRTRRFSEPTFRPSGAPNHWKNTVFRDFPTFSRICIFFLLIFSLLTLFTSAFQLSILSEVSLLNFLRSYLYVGGWPYHNWPLSRLVAPMNKGISSSRVNTMICCFWGLPNDSQAARVNMTLWRWVCWALRWKMSSWRHLAIRSAKLFEA